MYTSHSINLKQGQILSFKIPSPGWAMQCELGNVWLTLEGDAGDVIIETGKTHVFPVPGLVVVEALSDASITNLTPEGLAVSPREASVA